MVNVAALYEALVLVFSFDTLLWLAIGVFIGVGVGAMPGLTATTGVALMLPLTFTMGEAPALGLLIGLYKGAVYGGSISAISFATPGTSEAAATVFDGYKLMQQGKGRKALLMALYASVTADFLSDLITIMVAPSNQAFITPVRPFTCATAPLTAQTPTDRLKRPVTSAM